MQFIADLHIHSHYSIATSKKCDPDNLCIWAARKGLDLIGTGDFTHPGWREELRESLVEDGQGLFRLSDRRQSALAKDAPGLDLGSVRFILSGEISSIYKRHGKTRKVHNLVMVPTLEAADRIAARLSDIGNIRADGRPILGLDSHDLLEICLEECEEMMFVPAHIWTPHFSLFGAKSGFDTVEECFDDLASHITAMETGLSSDPPMNWRLSALDRFALISNSDAHSPANLARESNLFDCEVTYNAIKRALAGDEEGFLGTLEFFPEEGKYHYDGHRKCGVRWDPSEANAHNCVCPVCGKQVTQGVLHRVDMLADRPEGVRPATARHFERLVPLRSVISSALGSSEQTVAVRRVYESLIYSIGPELAILRTVPLDEIRAAAGALVAEGIGRVREGQLTIAPGFDGEYGKVEIFTDAERNELAGQTRLFEVPRADSGTGRRRSSRGSGKPAEPREEAATVDIQRSISLLDSLLPASEERACLNQQQSRAASLPQGTVVVIAGPGSGKTRTLVHRIGELVRNGVDPNCITAVTFTRKAASEVSARVSALFEDRPSMPLVRVGTFHSICMRILRMIPDFRGLLVMDELERASAIEEAVAISCGDSSPSPITQISKEISLLKSRCIRPGDEAVPDWLSDIYSEYDAILSRWNCLDYDDIILKTIDRWKQDLGVSRTFSPWFRHLLIDEFQDVNEAQFELTRVWSSESESLFIIGDPDQSIYGFRGSDNRYFEMMASGSSNTHRVSLIEGYRSQYIVTKAANAVIRYNRGTHAEITATRGKSTPILVSEFASDRSEAIGIVKEIERLVGGTDMLQAGELGTADHRIESDHTYGFSDISVLYRTGRQGDILEECLARAGIPYKVAGQTADSMDQEVSHVLALMKLAAEPAGAFRWLRCLRIPKYRLSTAGMRSVARDAADWRDSFVDAGRCYDRLKRVDLLADDQEKLCALVEDLQAVTSGLKELGPREAVERCIRQLNLPPVAALVRLIAYANGFNSVDEFENHLLFGKEGDWVRIGYGEQGSEHVSLMTIHAAKGLEFPVVFVAGCEEGLLPLTRRDSDDEHIEEERRLFYVAMTRAEDLLYLTHAVRRYQSHGDQPGKRSRFINEIPADCMSAATLGASRRFRQVSLF